MTRFLSALPTAWLATLAIVVSVTLALAGLLLVRRLIPHSVLREHNDVAGFIFAVLGVIYAVILAFVAIALWEDFTEVERLVQQEASITVGIYEQANALTEPTRSHMQAAIGTYVRLVIDEEWPRLASGHAGPQTSATLDRLWTVLRQNEPRTRREAIWHEQTLLSLKDLTRHREERLIAGRSQLQGVVWVALLLGSLVTVGYTYLYGVRNLTGQAIMTGAMAGLIGLMLALVVALDHPFTGPTSVTSEAFEMVLPTFGTHNQSIRNRSYSPARVPDRLPTRFTNSFGKTRRLRRGEKQVPSNKVTGIEVGLEHFATLANGQHIPNPRCFRTDEQALAKAQRRLRKTEQGTPGRAGWRRVVLSAGPQSPL